MLTHPIVDPSHDCISLIVIAVLPYLLVRYDNPNEHCTRAAAAIAAYCADELRKLRDAKKESDDTTVVDWSEHPLEHLATILRLYSRQSFR